MTDNLSGYLLIDKEVNWTSFDVVNKIRYSLKHAFGKKIKVGHAGTLDPLATGLLILCYGKMTKRIHEFQDMPKEYTGVIQLGGMTPSYDKETEVEKEFPTDHIDEELILRTRNKMLGKQFQRPPVFSAKKIDGKKAYELARKGEKVEMKKNEIEIFEFETSLINQNQLSFRVMCSKGTYIRSLAHDFGINLSSGAYLAELRRTAIGPYKVEKALTIDEAVTALKDNDESIEIHKEP